MTDISDDVCQISTSASDEPSATSDEKSTPNNTGNDFPVHENRGKPEFETPDGILTFTVSSTSHSTGESMEIDSSLDPTILQTNKLSSNDIQEAEKKSTRQLTSSDSDSDEISRPTTQRRLKKWESDAAVSKKQSDDDEETTNDKKTSSKARRIFRPVLDSDSEDSKPPTPTPDSEDPELTMINKKSAGKTSKSVLDSDSEDEMTVTQDKNVSDESVKPKKSSKISDLIDSESSEDESRRPEYVPSEEAPSTSRATKAKKEKPSTKRPVTKRAAKDEAMKEIHSETQRLLREAPVSLPYHRPRQRTLQEFLNRTKIASALPAKPLSQVTKLKMSAASMNEVVKAKEREAELFYKSSDSEDEVQTVPESEKTVLPLPVVPGTSSSGGKSPETVEIAPEAREISLKKHAVPRKLFSDDVVDLSGVPSSSETASDSVEGAEKPLESCKTSLNGVSAPKAIVDLTNCSTSSSGGDTSSRKLTQTSSDTSAVSFDTVAAGILTKTDVKSSLDHPQVRSDALGKPKNLIIDLTASQSSKSSTSETFSTPEVPKNPAISRETSGKNANSVKLSLANDDDDDDDDDDGPLLDPNCRIEGLPPIDLVSEVQPKKSEEISKEKKKIALTNIPPLRPKLQGAPGMLIDLTGPVKTNKTAVNTLLDRFITRHAVAKKPSESSGDVSVVLAEKTSEGVRIVQEKLAYKLPVDPLDDPMLSKPGAKLQSLREDLKQKMASKRHEEWKQREQELARMEEHFGDDEAEEEEDELDRAERKTREIEGSEAESEPEEDDIVIEDKKRDSCAFGDDEAEVSDDIDALSNDEEELEEQDEDIHLEDEGSDDEESEENSQDKRKKFSRIVTHDDDDSNSREPSPIGNHSEHSERPFASASADAEGFSNPKSTTIKPLDEEKTSFDDLESLRTSPSNIMTDSQLSSMFSQVPKVPETQKRLFIVDNKPVTDEELLSLCSGRFSTPGSSTQGENQPKLTGLINTTCEKQITDSQLLSLCSGKFPTQSSSISPTDLSGIDDSSQDLKLTLEAEEEEKEEEEGKESTATFKNILDDNKKNSDDKWTPLDIVSSESEDEFQLELRDSKDERKKRKVKRLVLSDDEGDNDDREFTDLDEEEAQEVVESDEEKYIDYDSEENEVVVVPKSDIKKVAANFLEHEAELSESDWGSEDEDEKDLDKLEREEGDAEDIDETQMRAQLGKMHVRQVLDDDQRDVRMLKEMLFDDGDLHTDGAGRQRKFKWKNMGNFADDRDLGPRADDDESSFQHDPADLASEVEWRNLRLQREKFLEEKRKSSTLEDDEDGDSQVLKFGMKVISKAKLSVETEVKNQVYKASIPRAVSQLMEGEGKSRILQQAMQRSSFLARDEQDLARMAALIKQNDSINLGPRHSRNFLFTHISPSVAEDSDDNNEVNAENIEKNRKRKLKAGATPRSSKKSKVETSRPPGKKLF